MKVVFKYLKPFAVTLLICFALLFVQAICDLGLPNLMSDIVNNGIQKNGITDKVPKALSENAYNLIIKFVDADDLASFESSFKRVEKGTKEYISDYPYVENGNIYVYVNTDEEILNRDEGIFATASFAFVNYISSFAEQMEEKGGQEVMNTSEGLSKEDLDRIYEITPMLSIPEAQAKIKEEIDRANAADAMMKEQMSGAFINVFYNELGMDIEGMQRDYLIKMAIWMLLVTLIGGAATIIVNFFGSRMGSKVAMRLRKDVFKKVESFSLAEFDKFSTSSLITRTTNDIQQIQMLLIMGIRMICYAPILAIGGIFMAVSKSLSLSWIIAVAIVVIIGIILIVFAVAMPKFKLLQKLIDKVNLVGRENLSGMLVIRAFGTEKYEEKKFDDANIELTKTNRFVQKTMAFMFPTMMFIMSSLSLAIIWVGSHAIAESAIQIGDMMAFIQYSMQILMSFIMISIMFIMVPRAAVSANRIKEILETEITIVDKDDPVTISDVKGNVEFKNVSFKFEGAEDDTLSNISFTAKSGETTAIIGATGSGKSTVINLIPRFYDVTSGTIELDGVDIRDISQQALRDNIGYIPQKGLLFKGTIESNIKYGKEEANLEEVMQAIDVAQAEEFVSSKEEGVETEIAQGGTNVSGGQRQRLSIARALIKKSPIYIFDDSFSALDFKTDKALRKALKEYTGESTVIIVAQRVNTIMNAEQILVLDEGVLVGKGTHKELIKTCDAYREIAESQLSKEELEDE